MTQESRSKRMLDLLVFGFVVAFFVAGYFVFGHPSRVITNENDRSSKIHISSAGEYDMNSLGASRSTRSFPANAARTLRRRVYRASKALLGEL